MTYDEMFKLQGYSCACCTAKDTDGIKQKWHVDHDHKTNKIRGICCEKCNRVIGQLGDDALSVIASVSIIMAYLRKSGDKPEDDILKTLGTYLLEGSVFIPEGSTPSLTPDRINKPRHGDTVDIGKNGLLGKNGSGYTP